MATCGTGYEDSARTYLEKRLDKEWKIFHKALIEFPHSFQLEDVEQLSKITCQKLVKAVQADLDDGLSTPLEIARSCNFLGYLHFLLNNPRESLLQIEKALNQDDEERNLVSLGNRAVMLWKTGDRPKAKDEVKALENLKKDNEFSYLVIRAKAELAYSYTRFGGSLCSKAVSLFTEVIAEAREPELWLWKFGLALTERRMAHMNNVPFLEDATEEKKLMSILHTLQEVKDKCQCDNLKAKCFSEIAHLLQETWGTKSQEVFENKAGFTSTSACEEALKLDPKDCSVLWKCGKIFRYAKRLDKSVELLQTAVTLRPTTTEYHHLGLTFKVLAIKSKKSEKGERSCRGRARPTNRRSRFGEGHGNRRGRCGRRDLGKESTAFLTEREGRGERDVESCRYTRGQNNRGWDTNPRRKETDLRDTGHFQFDGDKAIREVKSSNYAQSQNSRGLNPSTRRQGQGNSQDTEHFRRGMWNRNYNRHSAEGATAREWQHYPVTCSSYLGSYNQFCSSNKQMNPSARRQGQGNSQDTGHFRRGMWNRNYNRHSAVGATAREWQHYPVTCSSEFYFGSYNQFCSSNQQMNKRTGTSLNPANIEQGGDMKEKKVAEDASRHVQYKRSEATYRDAESSMAFTHSQDDQIMEASEAGTGAQAEQLPFHFSQLSLNPVNTPVKTKALPNSTHSSFTAVYKPKSTDNPIAVLCQQISEKASEAASQRDIQCFRQVVKSPFKKAVQFSRTDKFVQEAMDAFERAVEMSEGENTRAVYDLALMHKDLGEFDEALKLLDTILLSKRTMGPFEKINAYEQAGLILKEKSVMETDVEEQKKLNDEGESKLNMALCLCSGLCNRLPGLQPFIQHVWNAFPALLQLAEESDRHIKDKLTEKARLYKLIKDNHQSMALLKTISSIAPKEAENPVYLKICIENYVELEQFDQALAFIEMLNLTAQRSAMDHFDDSQYVQKVYIKAGKAALLNATSQDALIKANSHFSAAFVDTYRDSPDETSSSEDTDSIVEAHGGDSWDIMLLHEQSAESKPEALADIFTKVFGLSVTCMYQDCIPGIDLQESLFCIMKKSRLLVVLAGDHNVSPKYRHIIRRAVKRPTTVALLIDGDHIPEGIKKMTNDLRQTHHMVCPAELLTDSDCNDASAVLPQSQIQALCDVFSFLVNIPLT